MLFDQFVLNEVFLLKVMDSIVEITACILALYCFFHLLAKYKEKRTNPTFYLLVLFIVFSVTPIMQFLDGLFYAGHVDNFGIWSVQYGYSTILVTTAIANISLLFFSTNVFMTKGEKLSITIVIIRLILMIGMLFVAIYGAVMKIENQSVTLIIGIYMIFAIFMNLTLGIRAFQLASKISEEDYKRSIHSIGFFAFSLLGIYIFFIIDSFYPSYSIWGFFGWALFLFTTYLGYLGFVRPVKIKEEPINDKKIVV